VEVDVHLTNRAGNYYCSVKINAAYGIQQSVYFILELNHVQSAAVRPMAHDPSSPPTFLQ